VIGELDDFTVSRFEAECMRIALGSRLLIIELSTCSFLSSAGLRALVRLRRRLPTAIALVTGNAQFERLFHLAGLGHRPFTNLFDAMDAAASPGLWGQDSRGPMPRRAGRTPLPPSASGAHLESNLRGTKTDDQWANGGSDAWIQPTIVSSLLPRARSLRLERKEEARQLRLPSSRATPPPPENEFARRWSRLLLHLVE
jgi:anti-anti-sigma factor